MKHKYLLLLFFIIAGYSIQAQSIIGKWKGKTEREPVEMIFDSAGYFTMTIEGMTMGGKKFMAEGTTYFLKYEWNKAVKPTHLDIVQYNYATKKEVQRMVWIAEFMSDGKLKVAVNMESNVRPKDFSHKEDVIILTRKTK